jgi:hypothetical protein
VKALNSNPSTAKKEKITFPFMAGDGGMEGGMGKRRKGGRKEGL